MIDLLARKILLYVPSNLIPAAVAFLSVFAYTRLVDTSDYGVYSYIAAIALLFQATFFFWLQVGAMRFIARAHLEKTEHALLPTLYQSFLFTLPLFIVCYGVFAFFWGSDNIPLSCHFLGIALITTRGVVAINQAINRGRSRILRTNLIECGQSVLGLIFGLLLTRLLGPSPVALLLGLVLGTLAVLLGDIRHLLMAPFQRRDKPLLSELLRYGLPLTICNALGYILSSSDRLMIKSFLGNSVVGIYSASYNVVDRTITSVFLGITIAAFPSIIATLEKEGTQAASRQMTNNAIIIAIVTIPAAFGLIALNQQIAQFLLGASFRDGAAMIMPYIAVSSLISGFQVHFFDHIFHLGKKTVLQMLAIAPAAALKILLNYLLLPIYGIKAAIFSSIVCSMTAIICSIYLGRRIMRFHFPFMEVAKILLASLVMLYGLTRLHFANTLSGILLATFLGVCIYVAMSLALNVAGLTGRALALLRQEV